MKSRCWDTHVIPQNSSDSVLVPRCQEILSVSPGPGSASDCDNLIFFVDFIHILEGQVADYWVVTAGKHHPIGLALSV